MDLTMVIKVIISMLMFKISKLYFRILLYIFCSYFFLMFFIFIMKSVRMMVVERMLLSHFIHAFYYCDILYMKPFYSVKTLKNHILHLKVSMRTILNSEYHKDIHLIH